MKEGIGFQVGTSVIGGQGPGSAKYGQGAVSGGVVHDVVRLDLQAGEGSLSKSWGPCRCLHSPSHTIRTQKAFTAEPLMSPSVSLANILPS